MFESFKSFVFKLFVADNTNVALVISVILGLVLSEILLRKFEKAKKCYADRKKRRFIDEAKRTLQKSKFRVYMGTSKDVWGLTATKDFWDAYTDYMNPAKKPVPKLWDPVEIRPQFTYTFSRDDQDKRPVHTGTWDDARRILKCFAEKIVGHSLYSLTPAELEEVLKVLVIQDKRLFVPYSGRPEEGERQYAYYGLRTEGEFLVRLMGLAEEEGIFQS